MQRTCRMEGTAVAVFGNNPMQTWGLNNLFKVITSSGVGRVSRVQIRHAEM